MTPEVWLLVSWIVVGAALLVVHVLLVWLCVRAANLSGVMKAVSLLPPATPIVAWLSGRRAQPILWLVLLVVYISLRLSFSG